MTYYEFVSRPLALRRRIEHKADDVRLKESICMKSTAQMQERVQSSPDNTTELSYIRYIEACNDLERLMAGLEQVQNEVRLFLYANLAPDEADALEWRYIDDKTPQEIADIHGITYDAARARLSRGEKKAKKAFDLSQMSQNVTK